MFSKTGRELKRRSVAGSGAAVFCPTTIAIRCHSGSSPLIVVTSEITNMADSVTTCPSRPLSLMVQSSEASQLAPRRFGAWV